MTPKQKAIEIVGDAASLSYEILQLARNDFQRFSSEQMQREYGGSGRTYQQILDEHEQKLTDCLAALEWVKAQGDENDV